MDALDGEINVGTSTSLDEANALSPKGIGVWEVCDTLREWTGRATLQHLKFCR